MLIICFILNNRAYLFLQLANYYASKNKNPQAIEYYEKAFNSGYNNFDARKLYINILKHSEFSIKNQERIQKIAEDEIYDEANVEAKNFIREKTSDIHNRYQHNYVVQAPYNQKIIRWGINPITYTFINPDISDMDYINEIRNAFKEWENKNRSGIKFKEVNSKDANITIIFVDAKTAKKEIEIEKKFIAAYTTPEIINNQLKKMEIKFYTKFPNGEKFSNEQIYNIALHEIFHALGFTGHCFNKNNIMYISDYADTNSTTRKSLNEADISTLELLYKIKPDISNSKDISGEYLPIFVIGNDKEINYSKHKEAKNYISKVPELPNGYIDLAQNLVEQKKYSKAIKSLDKALELCSSKDEKYIIYYNLAVSYYYITNYEMSLIYIERAEKLNPTEELHLLKAETLIKLNKTEDAAKEYEFLCKINPGNIDYALGLANIYIKKHRYLKARKTIKTFIKNNPQEKNNRKFGIYRY